MTKVTKAMEMEDDMNCILLLLPSKTKKIGLIGTQATSPIVEVPGQKACEKLLSMEMYPSTEDFLNYMTGQDFCD
jgi:hypothetical protein